MLQEIRNRFLLLFMLQLVCIFVCSGSALAQNAAADSASVQPVKPNKINVVYCRDTAPFHYSDEDGNPAGMIIDLWRLWSEKTGIPVDFTPASWSDTLSMMREGKADAHAGLFFNDERKAYLDYGSVLGKSDTHIFYDKRLPAPQDNLDFMPYVIGFISGDSAENYLTEHFKGAHLIGFADFGQLMQALEQHKIKVFAADTPTALFHLQKAGLINRFAHKVNLPLYKSDWYVAVKKGNTGLLKIIDQGFASISDLDKKIIFRKWASGRKDLDANKLIIAVSDDYPPFSFVGPDGNPAGFLVDLWRLWSEQSDNPIVFRLSSWADSVSALRSDEVDIHSGMFRNESRDKWIDFSRPLYESPTAIFYRAERKEAPGLESLKGKAVGVLKGSYQEARLRAGHPDLKLISRDDCQSLILDLLKGQTEALVHEKLVVESDLASMRLLGFIVSGDALFSNEIMAGVLKGRDKLLARISQGLAAIPQFRLAQLESRWLPNAENPYYQSGPQNDWLTEEQRAWVRKNPVITIAATPNWPPFEFKEKGKYKGFHADVLRMAASKAGLRTEPVFGKWSDLVAMLKAGKVDLCPGLNATDERKQYLVFTDDAISSTDQVVISRTGEKVGTMDELKNKVVSVEKGYATERWLKENYPEVKIMLVDNTLSALKAVVTHKAQAYLGNQAVALYLMKQNTLSALEISAFVENAKRSEYRIGVIKSKPILRDILQKGFEAITDEEMAALQTKWFGMVMKTPEAKPVLHLTDEEKAWLDIQKKIKVAAVAEWPPFEFKGDNEGERLGISVDILNLAASRAGLGLEFSSGKMDDLLARLKQGKLDLVPGIAKSPELEKQVLFTDSYIASEDVIWVKEANQNITGPAGLAGKTIALEAGYSDRDQLQKRFPGAVIQVFNSAPEALQAVLKDKADAYVGLREVGQYLIEKNYISGLKAVARLGNDPVRLRMAIAKGLPFLQTIMQKALDSISQKERSDILRSYITARAGEEVVKPVTLSAEQREWLRRHQDIRLGVDPAFMPLEIMDPKSGFGGIASEYTHFISKQLSVDMKVVGGLSWQEALKRAKAGKLDLLPCVAKTPEREKYLLFTKPYMSFPVVIFTNKDTGFIGSTDDLRGATIGVVAGYAIQDSLKSDHPGLNIKEFDSPDEGLLALSAGKVSAFINDMATASYAINKHNLSNIKVAQITDYKFELSIGARKDWPELIPMLEKALDTVTPKMATDFKDKWMSVKLSVGLSLTTVLEWVLPVAGVLAVIILLIVLWNRRLGREINERKRAERELRRSRGLMEDIINSLPFWLSVQDRQGRYQLVNQLMAQSHGHTAESFISRNHGAFRPGGGRGPGRTARGN